jgi:hypothetical protein
MRDVSEILITAEMRSPKDYLRFTDGGELSDHEVAAGAEGIPRRADPWKGHY